VRWTRWAGWLNIVAGIATGAVMFAVGLGPIAVITGLAMIGSGAFMVWLAAGWDKPIEDLSTLNKYGRPANAVVLEAGEATLDGTGRRTAKLKLNVAPVNESDFITTRMLELPGGRVPAVGETVTVKFDPQKRKNLILLEENYMVESPTAAARRMIGGGPATLALAALLVLGLSAPAGAAVTRVTELPVEEIELAGQSVVFDSPGAPSRIVRADPGGTTATLLEYTGPGVDDDECCRTYFSTGFAASDKQIAVSTFYEAYAKGFLAQSDYELQTGPVNASPAQLFKCQGNHPYDVDGDRIAYLGDDCTEKTGNKVSGTNARVVIRNLAASGSPAVGSIPMTEQPNTLDLAGDFVALAGFYAKPPELRVYEFHSVDSSEIAYKLNHNFALFALQADGKVALAHTEQLSSDCRIEWYSKAEPTPHRLEFCPASGRIRMAGDRIAFDRSEGPAGLSLNVTTLAGARRAFTIFEPANTLTGFDFDGSRMAYGSRGCIRSDDVVWTDDLQTPDVDAPVVEGGPCTAAVLTKTARADKKGIVRVRVSCPEGCFAELSLYAGKSVASRRPARFGLVAGASKTVPIRLQTLRDVRRLGSRVYSARVSVDQRGPARRTFKGAVRVLRPKN
jgi:hypothetical protein